MTLILSFVTGYILQCRTLTATRWRPFTAVQWHSDDGQQRFLTWHWYCYLLQGIYFSVEHSPRPDDDLSLPSNDIPMTGSNDSLHDIDIVIFYRVYTSVLNTHHDPMTTFHCCPMTFRWWAATIPYMTLILSFVTGYILQCRTLTATRWWPFTPVQWHSDDGQQRFLTWHWYCHLLQGIYFSVEHSPRPDDDLSLLSNDIPMTGSNDSLHDIDLEDHVVIGNKF